MFRDFEQRYGDKIPDRAGRFHAVLGGRRRVERAARPRMNRASADRLTQAETLFAMFNPKAYPAEDFYQAWRNVILYDEHTWGAHNSISQPDAAVRQEPVGHQAAVRRRCRQPVAQAARRGERQPRTGRRAARRPKVQAIDVINTTSVSYPYALAVVPKELSLAGDVVKLAAEQRVARCRPSG